MGMGYGRDWILNPILENGSFQRLMGMEFIHGGMEIDMRENGKNASSMDKELIYSQTEMSILASTRMVNLMAQGNIYGLQALLMLVILCME